MARYLVGRIIAWLGGHELTMLVGLLIVVGGTWTFLAVADKVEKGGTETFDLQILRAMRDADDQPIGPIWMSELVRDITALGGYSVLTIVTASLVCFLSLDRKYGAMWFVIFAVVGGFALAMGLKSAFARDRPDEVTHLSQALTSSFPSGHSMMSAVVYLTLGSLLIRLVKRRELKFFFLALPFGLSLLIGCSRVYMGVHYPSDVLAGWAAGLAWATLCWLTARSLQRRGLVELEF